MIGLRGARVFVLDDDEAEALPMIKALGKSGIAVTFFDETMGNLPTLRKRLIGVRLAILDMDLGEGGNSEKAMASGVVKRLERIIHPDNGPYAALIWTNRPTVKEEFESYVFSSAVPKPVITVMITKAEVKNKKGTRFLVSKIAKRVKDELSTVGPLEALAAWEAANLSAAVGVTNTLSSLTIPRNTTLLTWRADWKQQLMELMRAMAGAKAGKHLEADSCIPSLYAALNPLHADRLGKDILQATSDSARHGPEIMAAIADPGDERKARINTMMHLDFHAFGRLEAGNLYFFTGVRPPAWIPKAGDILAGFIQGNTEELLNSCVPVVVEISATCDHAQKKVRMARLMAGVAAPSNLRKRHVNPKAVGREGTALWELGPLDLTGAGLPVGRFHLQFNARYVASLSLKQIGRLKSRARLRTEALSHIQSWFGFQSSRPGMMLLRET
jgi:hypothetical protein